MKQETKVHSVKSRVRSTPYVPRVLLVTSSCSEERQCALHPSYVFDPPHYILWMGTSEHRCRVSDAL